MNVNPNYLKSLLRIAAKQDIRYYLNGILVECSPEGGKFYVATDGHRIAVFHEGWGSDEPETARIIIPRDIVEMLRLPAKAFDGKRLPARLQQVADTPKWTLDAVVDPILTFTPIDGKFPEWRKAVPAGVVTGSASNYNFEYLRDFNLIAQEIIGSGFGAQLWQNGNEPALITIPSTDFLGVLMPMRFDAKMTLPAWYPKKEQTPEPA